MNLNIRQIGVDFDAAQDRLMLKISIDPGRVLRFLISRRYLKLFWTHVVGLMEKHGLADPTLSESARRAVREMRQEEALAKADFGKPFQEGPAVGGPFERPLLLTAIRFELRERGHWQLSLIPPDGPSVDLNLPDHLVLAICKLLREAALRAEWNLDLKLFDAAPAAEPVARRLN